LMLHAKATVDKKLADVVEAVLNFHRAACTELNGETLATLRSIAKGFSGSAYRRELEAVGCLREDRWSGKRGVTGLRGKRGVDGAFEEPEPVPGGLMNLSKIVATAVKKSVVVSEALQRVVRAGRMKGKAPHSGSAKRGLVRLMLHYTLVEVGGKISLHLCTSGDCWEQIEVGA